MSGKTAGNKTETKTEVKTETEAKSGGGFTPTFRKYGEMNSGEQAAFRQGAATVSNKVKENLGLKKKKDD